jgi:uncharacterized protein YciI
MKRHCIIIITYTAPFEQVSQHIVDHRSFLQTGYDKGMLLLSGPQNPKIGGIIVARGQSLEEIKQFMAGDPYLQRGVANYQFIEFEPVKSQSFMEDWIAGK